MILFSFFSFSLLHCLWPATGDEAAAPLFPSALLTPQFIFNLHAMRNERRQLEMIVLGSSVSSGAKLPSNSSHQKYVYRLKERLERALALRRRLLLYNFAVGASRCEYARFCNMRQIAPPHRIIDSVNADIVIIAHHLVMEETACEGMLRHLLSPAHRRRPRLIVIADVTVRSIDMHSDNLARIRRNMLAYYDAYRQSTAPLAVFSMSIVFSNLLLHGNAYEHQTHSLPPRWYLSENDDVHPSVAGHDVLATHLFYFVFENALRRRLLRSTMNHLRPYSPNKTPTAHVRALVEVERVGRCLSAAEQRRNLTDGSSRLLATSLADSAHSARNFPSFSIESVPNSALHKERWMSSRRGARISFELFNVSHTVRVCFYQHYEVLGNALAWIENDLGGVYNRHKTLLRGRLSLPPQSSTSDAALLRGHNEIVVVCDNDQSLSNELQQEQYLTQSYGASEGRPPPCPQRRSLTLTIEAQDNDQVQIVAILFN